MNTRGLTTEVCQLLATIRPRSGEDNGHLQMRSLLLAFLHQDRYRAALCRAISAGLDSFAGHLDDAPAMRWISSIGMQEYGVVRRMCESFTLAWTSMPNESKQFELSKMVGNCLCLNQRQELLADTPEEMDDLSPLSVSENWSPEVEALLQDLIQHRSPFKVGMAELFPAVLEFQDLGFADLLADIGVDVKAVEGYADHPEETTKWWNASASPDPGENNGMPDAGHLIFVSLLGWPRRRAEVNGMMGFGSGLGKSKEWSDIADEEVKQPSSKALSGFAIDLNKMATEERLDPLVGRKAEMGEMLTILSRRTRCNPILVGEPGVGKTALANGLASAIVKGEVPEGLSRAHIWSLDLGSLVAGTRYRGDFEERFKNLVKELKTDRNNILFIDEIHTLLGAGGASGGALDAANMLKPLLAEGSIRVIGSTTLEEFRRIFSKDKAMLRRFQKLAIQPPSRDETLTILKGLAPQFEAFQGVSYTPLALEAAVDLSIQHIPDRCLPDKAIDLLDEAGARARLSASPVAVQGSKLHYEGRVPLRVDVSNIEEALAKMTGIERSRLVKTAEQDKLRHLKGTILRSLYGQDDAVGIVVSAVLLARSGLGNPDHPRGSFLLTGPTGVGKTELAKQLSAALQLPLLRFDMSEYQEAHSVARLIGAPSGYVGHEEGGLLTEAVFAHPHSVLLLDELEKAHPAVYNLLLQAMDNGFLTDSNGRQVDFRNVTLLMTSNLGATASLRRSIGFSADMSGKADTEVAKTAALGHFSPEFRNRLDAVVVFSPLSSEDVKRVVNRQLALLGERLLEHHVVLDVDAEARELLAQKGFDPQMGARPLERTITDLIAKPLSEKLLFEGWEDGVAKVSLSASNPEQLQIQHLESPIVSEAAETENCLPVGV